MTDETQTKRIAEILSKPDEHGRTLTREFSAEEADAFVTYAETSGALAWSWNPATPTAITEQHRLFDVERLARVMDANELERKGLQTLALLSMTGSPAPFIPESTPHVEFKPSVPYSLRNARRIHEERREHERYLAEVGEGILGVAYAKVANVFRLQGLAAGVVGGDHRFYLAAAYMLDQRQTHMLLGPVESQGFSGVICAMPREELQLVYLAHDLAEARRQQAQERADRARREREEREAAEAAERERWQGMSGAERIAEYTDVKVSPTAIRLAAKPGLSAQCQSYGAPVNWGATHPLPHLGLDEADEQGARYALVRYYALEAQRRAEDMRSQIRQAPTGAESRRLRGKLGALEKAARHNGEAEPELSHVADVAPDLDFEVTYAPDGSSVVIAMSREDRERVASIVKAHREALAAEAAREAEEARKAEAEAEAKRQAEAEQRRMVAEQRAAEEAIRQRVREAEQLEIERLTA